MNISQRLRTCAKHTGLDAVIELLQEAADEIDRLKGAQPADVTDERQAFEKWLGIRPCGAAHDMAWSAWKARSILALRPATNNNLACESVQARLAAQWGYVRPVQVPMTREQAMAIVQSNPDTMTAIRMTEAHHGITAQVKKETP